MSEFLEKHLNQLVSRTQSDVQAEEVRFSLTFSTYNNRRIEYIRRALKLSKQEFLQGIILAALNDLEVKMDLAAVTKNGMIVKNPEYEEKLASEKPIKKILKEE
ncbi:hypothetical protein I532_04135 [Brevibacillus borstelensis AK1]|uniref:Uncharacterized protein n=1 Tax=Brevibacillus borstelensis AK1 TaxID=1300222 RepID=M8EH18_9BACL|nr:hypothetical protein [Brevibacillus borstelensis]EMT54765.1 hypothetical protein I532_04135 [Brevibacillus borstelensis AK1]